MSSPKGGPDSNRTLVMAAVRTLLQGGGFWVGWFIITWLYIGMADVAGAGWDNFTTQDHLQKFWGPAMKVWLACYFLQGYVKDGSKKWWLLTIMIIPLSFGLFCWALTDVPMGGVGRFWFRSGPAEIFGESGLQLAEYLFPDLEPAQVQ